jgi:hypothetical protein
MMIWRVFALLAVGVVLTPSDARAQYAIPMNATIFVEEMANDLDGFIRAEFVKQKVPLRLVLSADDAELVLTGSAVQGEKKSWHEGWLSPSKDRLSGNTMVVEKSTNTMLWAGEAGDRSLFWGSLARGGERKVASRLVKNLKKAIKPRPTATSTPK